MGQALRSGSDEAKSDQFNNIDGACSVCDGSRRSVLPPVSVEAGHAADKPIRIHTAGICFERKRVILC